MGVDPSRCAVARRSRTGLPCNTGPFLGWLEHDRRPWRSVLEMARVLRPSGRLLLTCRGYDERGCFPVHDYPDDLWRFTATSVRLLLADAGLTDIDAIPDPQTPGVFAAARKPER